MGGKDQEPRCQHVDCGYRLSLHFGTPPQFCRLNTFGEIDTSKQFKGSRETVRARTAGNEVREVG